MIEIGSLVDGKYKVLSEIGHGGMSVVYLAVNEKANKTWAIKEVRRDGVIDFEAVKQGLIVETDMLKKLHHPNLPSIIDVIEDDETLIIVMDYVEGVSLNKKLDEFGAQPQEAVIDWGIQMCDVLDYLHNQSPPIIYRDMKPANIMYRENDSYGHCTLIDFGTAREFKAKKVEDTTCLGTIGYAAPEQFGGMGQTDGRTDVYGLGASLYHLVTGMNPCEPPYEIKPIRSINPSLSNGLEQVLLKATKKDPNERYQSAAEFKSALEHYWALDEDFRRKQKRKVLFFALALSFAIIFLIAGFALNGLAKSTASNTYESLMIEASKLNVTQEDQYKEKISMYEHCIALPDKAGISDAYLGLIKTYKENDSKFTKSEEEQIKKIVLNNQEVLLEDPSQYAEICFEIGKLYWYYYDYGNTEDNRITRAKSSIEWFEDVLNYAPASFENRGMAKVYANIGIFYRDITMNVVEASDKGQYKDLFDNLTTLIDSTATDETESETVRFEMLELTRAAIQQYATKFKSDGVSQADLEGLYKKVASITKSIHTDEQVDKQNAIIDLLEDTKYAIDVAYGTKKDKGD